MSFRMFAIPVVPGLNPRKQAVLGLALLLAGCGGSGGSGLEEQQVRGAGFVFAAPSGWSVARSGDELRVSRGVSVVSVAKFPLVRAFRPELWGRVVPELDRAAAAVAEQQGGTVGNAGTVTIADRRARRYDVDYEHDGKQLVERIAFVLRAKTEYLLLCRYERGGDTRACDRLLATFRLT